MADKKLSDYLHHYIGGICREVNTGEEFTITPEVYCKIISGELNAKPVLFGDTICMPDDKYKEYTKLNETAEENQWVLFDFLTKNSVDLFYLVDAGLAIPDDTHFLRKLEIATELNNSRRKQVA